MPPVELPAHVLSRYRRAPVGTRFFLFWRWHLTPYRRIASRLPARGRVLDLGCGHGLLSFALAVGGPDREVLGIDHDPARVACASEAATGQANLRFEPGNILQCETPGPFQGVALVDLMHYFPPEQQEKLIRDAHDRLGPSGILLVREVDPATGIASSWNRIYEKIATKTGFTRTEAHTMFFRTVSEWKGLIERHGFRVSAERCSSALFSDTLFICVRLP